METYSVLVRGTEQGSITTSDIHGHMESTYPGISFHVNEEKKEVHLHLTLLEAMRFAKREAEKHQNTEMGG
ncbi:hypothetical protein [Aneurinibacillus aneurinilyticus]|uniref:hypothetical protein n=1 Tax=Aneurinibacillus aneurinilyticus TaxID=1391 RepID=UPI0023EF8403|nr:hypothetical protein [Aneurinibacillus aneurinilyticus]